MLDFIKKALWQYYVIVLAIFIVVLVWGLSGVLWGGGQMYRLFTSYLVYPGVTGFFGVILGIKSARYKWLYPFYSGGLAFIAALILFRGSILLLMSYFAFPFLAAIIGLCIGAIIFKTRSETKIKLKMITKMALAVFSIILFTHIIHAFTLDRIVEYTEVSFYSPNLPPRLDGYRIAFIVDTHYMSVGRMTGIVDELNQRELDLLVLGGDFAMIAGGMQMRTALEIFSQIETTDGIYGVEGNHDNYRHLFAAMEAHGMMPLSNSGYHVREGIFIAGVHDLWNRSPNVAAAVEGARPDDFVLLISHNPDVAMQQDTTHVDLILSGHTHGGQITFFGLWAPYLTIFNSITDYGQRFRAGWSESRDGTPVYVSRGVGEYLPRVFARPQVVIITLWRCDTVGGNQ